MLFFLTMRQQSDIIDSVQSQSIVASIGAIDSAIDSFAAILRSSICSCKLKVINGICRQDNKQIEIIQITWNMRAYWLLSPRYSYTKYLHAPATEDIGEFYLLFFFDDSCQNTKNLPSCCCCWCGAIESFVISCRDAPTPLICECVCVCICDFVRNA